MCAERIAPPDPRAALQGALTALKVFPLHAAVILPGTPAPLHVFEARYEALVREALRGDRIVAVPSLLRKADAHASRPTLRPVCGAGIIESEERYRDGRYDIVVRGLARVRLVEEVSRRKMYREFRAEVLEERLPQGGAAALGGEVEALRQIVYELSTKLPPESGAPELAEAVAQMKDPSAIVDLVAAAAVSDPDDRQRVLEELDVARRLEMVLEEVAGVVLVLSRGRRPQA